MSESMDTKFPYRGQAIREYGREVEKFRGLMWVLMHITGGQPARAPELLGVRMWNTMNGGVRNIFIHEAMVCFVTMYHKGFRKSSEIKVIHRFLPREVGELLVWYMWLVLPFWQNVQGTIKQKRRTSAFLWADEVVGEDGRKERKMNTVVSSFEKRVKEEKKMKREAKSQQREARKQRKEAKKQRRAEESIRMGRRGRAAGSEEGWEMVSDERETVEGEEEWEEQDGRDGDEVPDVESEDKGPDVEGEDEGPDVPEATPKPEEDQEEEAAFMEWFHEPKWTSDRARRVLQRYSAEYSGHELNISVWRHIAIGISNRYFNKVFGDGMGDGFDEGEDEGIRSLIDSIYDLQAGHGSHVGGLVYARMFGQGDLGTMRSREQFRKVSMQWHQFFGLGAEDRTEWITGAKRGRSMFDADREDVRRKRFGRLHRMDMQGQLQQMMGPAVAFRGLQEPVIRAVVRGEWPIVQITPTGGGKSLTFMLPAYCTPDGMTIVVTPLVALENDMNTRCAKMGIDSYVWSSRGVQRAASLVFVTPESAVTKGFRAFVERMHGQQRLDRVVVDECHTVLQCSKTFRPQVARLGQVLQEFGVPVVCLTATLKPTQEKALFAALRFIPERVRMFREPTTRPNIRYRVIILEDGEEAGQGGGKKKKKRAKAKAKAKVKVNGEGEEEGEEDDAIVERVCEIVRAWTATHSRGKVIIYGGTIKRVEQITAILGCVGYWRGVGSAKEKARRVEEWRNSKGGKAGWIASTNALGMGIDDPGVCLVVHAGIPRQLVNVVQESGRGGRGGQRSESVVVVRRSWLVQQRQQKEQEKEKQLRGKKSGQPDQWAWDDDVIEFAEGKRCRREVLDREMDGNKDRIGCVEGEEACDVCQGHRVARAMHELTECEPWWENEEGEWVDRVEEDEEERREAEIEADYQRSQRPIRENERNREVQVMRETAELHQFEDMLAAWAGRCAVCMMQGADEVEHRMEVCPERNTWKWESVQKGVEDVTEEMITKQRFARFSACFDCALPQAICCQWVEASNDGRLFKRDRTKKCQYPGVLFEILVAQRVRGVEWWWWWMKKMMGVEDLDATDAEDMAKVYTWLGEMVEWGGRVGGAIQASRMCQVVTRLEKEWVEE